MRLLKNPIYVCEVLGTALRLFAVLGYATFKPKYIESEYKKSASAANLFTGNLPMSLHKFTMVVIFIRCRRNDSYCGGNILRWNIHSDVQAKAKNTDLFYHDRRNTWRIRNIHGSIFRMPKLAIRRLSNSFKVQAIIFGIILINHGDVADSKCRPRATVTVRVSSRHSNQCVALILRPIIFHHASLAAKRIQTMASISMAQLYRIGIFFKILIILVLPL